MNSIQLFVVALTLMTMTVTLVQTYRQELILYEGETGNSFTFLSHIPDATIYPFENITRICYRGHWTVYSGTGYNVERTIFHNGPWECSNGQFPYKSFRHVANPETTEDGLSLYTGGYWAGKEILVTDMVTASVPGTIQSIAWTGNSTWTLFEGPSFTGKRICIEQPPAQFEFYAYGNIEYILGISNVQSVIRGGCYLDLSTQEILQIVNTHLNK